MSNRNISDASVHKATGKTWREWLADISQAETKPWTHKKIAEYLHDERNLTPWWSQMVAVTYEKMRGRRVTGEKADATFQVGVQKTFFVCNANVWELLISQEGTALWLGDSEEAITFEEGAEYRTRSGLKGVVKKLKQSEYIRLVWRHPEWSKASILHVRVSKPSEGKTTVIFHHEDLPNRTERDRMGVRWREVLAGIEEKMVTK